MLPLFNIVLAAFFGRQNLASNLSNQVSGVCDLPLAVGNCSRDFPRYYYNADTGLCYRFTYSGCGGNANRFHSKLHCKQRCVKGWSTGRTKVAASFKDPLHSLMCDGCSEKDGVCVNGLCQCRKGYEMVKNRCVDSNECLWQRCPENAVCKNLVGSFICECKSGWAGSGLNCSKNRDSCSQTFDPRYEGRCGDTNEWSIRYFYNSVADVCQRFWHSGCQYAESMNFFNDVQSCESLCLKRPKNVAENTSISPGQLVEMTATTTEMPFPVVCLDEFDQRRRNPCIYGEWTRRYYFDHHSKRCMMFWYDQSCGIQQQFSSRNVFVYLSTCMRACEGINPDSRPEIEPTIISVSPITTTLQPFHPHLHKQQHHKHGLFPDQHLSTEVNPTYSIYPQSTLETIIRPIPKSTLVSEQKTIGVIQAMFTVANASQDPITKNEILEAATGRPLDEEDLKFDDLTNLIDTSPNWNTIGSSVVEKDRSSDCFVAFDRNLLRSCSNGRRPWKPRYYYDGKTCKLYWNDGCQSHSKNNFGDLPTCQWLCEGKNLRPDAVYCLDEFDKAYTENCRDGKYEMRYFFDKSSKSCKLMYWGGCKSKSRNIFENLRDCEDLCVSSTRNTIESCHEPFDAAYRGLCDRNAGYQQRYYFDISTLSCRMFWFGSCPGRGRNIFNDLTSCQWLCEKKREHKIPSHCMDRFDRNYLKACNRGGWSKRFYFNHSSGECQSFWYGGCEGLSQNIFISKETCRSLCEEPALPTEATMDAISRESSLQKEIHRCIEPLQIGNGFHTYPAYYYNKESGRCEPFAYSGANGNGNRFLTLSQCQNTCHRFKDVKIDEMICYLPLSVGYGRGNKTCIKDAGYRFYFNSKYNKCGRFWYFGCGKNQNHFDSPDECEKLCQGNSVEKIKNESKSLSACFQKIDPGKCEISEEPKNETRFGYVPETKLCQPFEYTNCGGNENRWNTETECKDFCGKLIAPNSDKCVHPPDWGPCNQLRYMWFYNLSSGICEQFLYGGCAGNTNRFESFELCQVSCEVPSEANDTDICKDKLDRGQWCEPMKNRYYYHQKSKSCKGFHYTGCGKSRNNFNDIQDCEDVCIHRKRPTSLVPLISALTNGSALNLKYAGTKPSEKPDIEKHIILSEDAQRYVKSDGEWLEYNKCIGFRYNVSGAYTRLKSYICLMEEGGTCQVQTLSDTNGEERCQLIKPWLRGEHFYTWFFTVQRRAWRWSFKARRRQSPQDTIASLFILPGVKDCNALC